MPKAVKKAPVKKKAKSTRSSSFDLPIAPVVRIAKNSGAERISMDGTRAIVARTEKYIAEIARKAANAAASEGRKTIKAEDVEKF
ncbi:MAG TPA: NFYB/HAP3 family transcription factor subunit [Methanolinea sp.]|nr:NFYB/HAP3 family transcription factor subunit [Methanolinea sp.]